MRPACQAMGAPIEIREASVHAAVRGETRSPRLGLLSAVEMECEYRRCVRATRSSRRSMPLAR